MPNNKDIYRNKKDFAREEFATELYKPDGRPRPREKTSQESQLHSEHQHGTRKDMKRGMTKKIK